MSNRGARVPRVDIRAGPPVTVVLTGAWHDTDAPRLRAVLDTLATNPVVELVQVDVAGVDRCEVSILGELLRAHQKLSARAGRLELLRPGPAVRDRLNITGLAPLLPIGPHTESAAADRAPVDPAPSTSAGTTSEFAPAADGRHLRKCP